MNAVISVVGAMAACLAVPSDAAKFERDGWAMQPAAGCVPRIEQVDARPTYDAQARAELARDPLMRLKPDYHDMPAHLRFDLGACYGEPGMFDASLRVLPVDAYRRIQDDGRAPGTHLSTMFGELRSWIAAGPDAIADWPMVPYLDMSPQFTVQRRALHFRGGQGIRVVTQFVPDVGFATSRLVSYVFQGLTDDGRTFVLMTVPLTLTGAADADAVEHLGFTFEQIEKREGARRYEKAVGALIAKHGVKPSLAELDALIESLAGDSQRHGLRVAAPPSR